MPPTIGVMDVAFISILKILPALRDVLGEQGQILTLIKPQFEAGRDAIGKNGVVSKIETHRRVLRDIQANAPQCGWRVRAMDFSPIQGGDGNLEFLADLVPADSGAPADAIDIDSIVRRAHAAFRENKANIQASDSSAKACSASRTASGDSSELI